MDFIADFDLFGYNLYAENNTYNYDDYNDNHTFHDEPVFKHKSRCSEDISCAAVVVATVLIFLLGFLGNGLVIWISGFKMKRTVNTTWYLSLAISDFIFCACLPFSISNTVMDEWIFGLVMCKVTSFVMFLNMLSSIFLLVIISVDRCVSVVFPVWAQNQRTVNKATAAVSIAWVLAVGLSIPAVVFRDVSNHLGKTSCVTNYTSHPYGHMTVAVSRFIGGFVVPFFLIIICYSIIIVKLCTNKMTKSSKPFKVMTALIAAFFICWLPYHIFILLELDHHNNSTVLTMGLKVGTLTAAANSLLNPVLYVFMGNDFKQTFKSSVLSKMENAMGEEGRTMSRYLSRSSSWDQRASTHI
ncbi:chemokine-like receptor 1 [Genypterus blacodes]|uniref:chemokine-like receptor 1 n=1 Tax=Genypterus blacodes TaxID=154954 RepID=UPI003F75EC4B